MSKKRVVIKIGSSNLVKNGQVDGEKIEKLVEILTSYDDEKFEFIIVTSGAVAIGREKLKVNNYLNIRQKQALAAVGQPMLLKKYEEAFAKKNKMVAQVLLTKDDLHNRKRYINSRETIWEMLKYNLIPIINENDTVSTDELKIGDNDNLSALVASATEADILIILSDIDGLYTKNPKKYDDAELIKEVREITPTMIENSGGTGSKHGTGGMITKLEAANICMSFGIEMIIINGENISNVKDVLEDKEIGTKFYPDENIKSKRKMWIAYGLNSLGKIFIDDGAKRALLRGKSLLASGIINIQGEFTIGEMVSIYTIKNIEIARGLINYNNNEVLQIKGEQSSEIENILGYYYKDEVIHRDNMYILDEYDKEKNN